MKIQKILAVCLSALLFATTAGCNAPSGEKAENSGASSASASQVLSSSSAPEVVSAQSADSKTTSGADGSPSAGKWLQKASMSTPRFDGGSAVAGGKIYLFGGMTTDDYHGTALAEVYDPASNQWQNIKSMPTGVYDVQAAVLNGKIYAVGGLKSDKSAYLANVERYDPATDTWTDLKPMSIAQNGFSLAMLDGEIYAIGGRDDKGNPLSLVEAYDPDSNTWAKKTPMLSPLEVGDAEVIDNKIYVIGGMRSVNGTYSGLDANSMEMYDPKQNQWTKKTAMHISRIGFSAAVTGGKIYAIGGIDPHNNEGGSMVGVLTSMEEYDPVTDKWTVKAPMIEKKSSFQTAVLNGKIYVIDGWNDIKYGDQAANYLSSVQEYDPQTNKWTEKSPLKMGRKEFETPVVGDSIYAIGGRVGPDRGGIGTALVEECTATK